MVRVWALAAALGVAAVTATVPAGAARAAAAEVIDAKVDIALNSLLAESPAAQAIAEKAVAVLVFPEIIKGGLGFGGQYGEGALRRNDATVGYYHIASASFGFQIGAQAYAQAIFFMTEEALAYLNQSKGFEAGVDATVAVVDKGVEADASTSTIQDPIVAFVFGQKGLMAGATLEGSKITRINPNCPPPPATAGRSRRTSAPA
jgi:lipid-binding SYLF domain-containing protein